jgi:phage tail-like protein
MADGVKSDPFRGFKFRVDIQGFEGRAGFQKVSGLKEATEVVEYREGTDKVTQNKLPGLTTYDNVTLERGLADGHHFREWREQIVKIQQSGNKAPDGTLQPLVAETGFRRDVTITLVDKGGRDVKQWDLAEAWPCALEYSDLDAMSSDVVVETLELCHEGITETKLI